MAKAALISATVASLVAIPAQATERAEPEVFTQHFAPVRWGSSIDWKKWEPILACESGGNWRFADGSYEGGLNFDPTTFDAFKPKGYPDSAAEATPWQQMYVAERVLADQSWSAWPVCSRKAGYR
jgi:hypothetical protein